MNDQATAIRIQVDVTNPGQFFACCGLVELAERMSPCETLCRFDDQMFYIVTQDRPECSRPLEKWWETIPQLNIKPLDPNDDKASPIHLEVGDGLRLDWWQDPTGIGPLLKTWAGSQSGFRIAHAMQKAIQAIEPSQAEYGLNVSTVVYDPDVPDQKVEPFYFDSRRGARPFSRDIGFSPDALEMTTLAYPAVEFLCLVGLQRCRPRPADKPRLFDYYTWKVPLPVSVLPAAVCGLLPAVGARGYRFENAFRTDQRKHKAFSPAVPL